MIGGSVALGTRLCYLGRPFTVVKVHPMDPHPTLGRRWLATDERDRGVIVYEDHPVTVVCG